MDITNFNIAFQLAALLFTVLFLSFSIGEFTRVTRRTIIFVVQIVICILNLLVDITSVIFITYYISYKLLGYEISPWLNFWTHFFGKAYIVLTVSFLYTILIYVANACHYRGIGKKGSKIINIVVLLLSVGAIMVSIMAIIEPLYFDGDGFRVWSYGTGASATYYYGAFCSICAVVNFSVGWKNMSHRERGPIVAFLITQGGVALIQSFFPNYLILGLGNALTEAFIYKSLTVHEKNKVHNDTINSFAEIIEAREKNTGEHIKRTKKYVQIIADELLKINYDRKLINKDWTNLLSQAAALHDLGKLPIPNAVLSKPGKLTDEEYALIKKHPEFGAKIIKNSLDKIGDPMFQELAWEMAYTHHEKWDGSGYPRGLKGSEIPLSGQIMAVADVFDAVSQKRCYRAAMTLDESFSIITNGIGTHFNPDIAKAFIKARPVVEKAYMVFIEQQNELEAAEAQAASKKPED